VHDGLFDRDSVLDCLRKLGEILAERNVPHQTLILIGGSYLALRDLRESTRDIDTVTHLDAETRLAISDVAKLNGLDRAWLNDFAAGFRPAGLTTAHCSPILEMVRSPSWHHQPIGCFS
jgi:hypothetical protein